MPTAILAAIDQASQGSPGLGVVAVIAVVFLGVVACRDLLADLFRYLSRVRVQTEKSGEQVDVNVEFRDKPSPRRRPKL